MIVETKRSKRVEKLYNLISPCKLCPRECEADRLSGQTGFCGAGDKVRISSHGQHLGEEPPISGIAGSGTIFFSYCTMSCKFCQNYPISQLHNGYDVSVEKLADIFLEQQTKGCHNVNLVTPTHFVPQIAEALEIAKKNGLSIPVVYNTSGFESAEVLNLLDGFVDIYLPDMKYSNDKQALENSATNEYVSANREAVLVMGKQVGELELDDSGIAKKGLIIRHLVLPEDRAGTENVIKWIAQNISYARMSLMSQYFPAHSAVKCPGLNRKISAQEYNSAVSTMKKGGLSGWIQPL